MLCFDAICEQALCEEETPDDVPAPGQKVRGLVVVQGSRGVVYVQTSRGEVIGD